MTFEQLLEEKWAIVGSPETVIASLSEFTSELGAGRVVLSASWGAMPRWMAQKNLELLAEEVIPHFRGPDGKPVWAREERPAPHTLTEHAATVGRPKTPPLVALDGALVDSSRAHIPELRNQRG